MFFCRSRFCLVHFKKEDISFVTFTMTFWFTLGPFLLNTFIIPLRLSWPLFNWPFNMISFPRLGIGFNYENQLFLTVGIGLKITLRVGFILTRVFHSQSSGNSFQRISLLRPQTPLQMNWKPIIVIPMKARLMKSETNET